ncbi:hypothetical protein YTPLAS21_01250 [Candidatus Nitrosocosmicus sp.]|jgi:hypothetical protein|nr:hypothetical protein YTPLAS21_00870 [Candidatus Nitrosocosmicus sp.]GKS60667.1 hypothetical protein YTPLAS21_01250 [Candidatus Nitrosocosmicus sp.]
MSIYLRATLVVLIFIVVTGLVAIPFGNPNFIDRAIALELSFVTLSVLLWRGYSKALYACIPIAILVIIGNSLAPPHVNLMMTFSKPLNAIVLIVGGYILQIALIYASLRAIINIRSNRMTTTT